MNAWQGSEQGSTKPYNAVLIHSAIMSNNLTRRSADGLLPRGQNTQPNGLAVWLATLLSACAGAANRGWIIRCGAVSLEVALLTGCAGVTKTGEQTQMNSAAVSQIRNLGVQVKVLEDFSVVLTQDQMESGGFVLAGVLGASIQDAGQTAKDAQIAAALSPQLGGLNCQELLTSTLCEGLGKAGRFSTVQTAQGASPATQCDALLVVKVKAWGLRTGSGEHGTRKAQAAISAHVSLVPAAGGRPLWERADYFLGSSVRPVEEFSRTEGLLRRELEETLNRYANRIVNEIRFN